MNTRWQRLQILAAVFLLLLVGFCRMVSDV